MSKQRITTEVKTISLYRNVKIAEGQENGIACPCRGS